MLVDLMPKTVGDLVVGVRLGRDVIRRADAVAKTLKRDPAHGAARISRAYVIRLAVLRGLAEMEKAQ